MKNKITLILIAGLISIVFWQSFETLIYSQSKALTLGQVKNSLNVSPDKKKESAITARKVRQVGVAFPLTPKIEGELRRAGANDELIEAIRQNSPETSNSNANAQVKTGVPTIADMEIAVIEMEQPTFGTIKIELYSNIAPKMVERFKTLAKEGVYNGTTFHRVNQSVIQGGDPLSKDANPANDGTGQSDKPNVPAEFSDIQYDIGILGAARSQDVNSANSQFFITLKREEAFDKKYTIFGKVIGGMGNVNTIARVQPKNGERPIEDVRIKSITIRRNDFSASGKGMKNSIGMEFVYIPSGSFEMGSNDGEKNEKPVHRVTISDGFYVGKYEVTQEEYEKVMGTNPSNFKNCPRCPVEQVSWNDAVDFVRQLALKNHGLYRLPTEAEWEYAARGGTTTKWSFGNVESSLGVYAWYSENSGSRTHEVGTKQPNGFGLYDVHGNVGEWCWDWYDVYPSGEVTYPTGATSGLTRVGRGGGWGSPAIHLRSALRYGDSPSYRSKYGGFRVVLITL